MRFEERVESGANSKEDYRNKHAHHTIHHDAVARTAFVLGGEVTLNDRLVRGVRNEVVGHTAQDDDPESSTAVVETPVEHLELVGIKSYVNKAAETTFGAERQIEEGEEGSTYEDNALNYVAPYHGLNTTHGAVENSDKRHEHNADVEVDTRYGSQRERGQIQHQCHASHHKHNKQRRSQQTGGGVETAFKVFVGTRYVQAAEEGQVVLNHRERHE